MSAPGESCHSRRVGLRELFDATLTALFPPRCGACTAAMAVRSRFGLCDICQEVLEPNCGPRCPGCDLPEQAGRCRECAACPPPFTALRAPFVYGGPLADLVVAAKFRGREDLAVALGRLLAADDEVLQLALGATHIIPVPLGPKRRRQRGYNQAAVMARVLARQSDRPLLHALRRLRDTPPQSDLPLVDRQGNLRGAFAARRAVTGRVLLIDDVVTSGATVREAAAALIAAGATEVVVAAAARASAA